MTATQTKESKATVFALLATCLLVAMAAVVWKGWDMFGPRHRPMLQGWNDSFYYFWLPTVVIDHDLDFAKPLATSNTIRPHDRDAGLEMPRTATGLLPNKYPPGWALGSLPFFLTARLFASPASTGFEPIYLVAVWVGQMFYAALGLWFAVLIIRRLLPGAPAAATVLAVWLASPLVYYQSARVSLSHSQLFTLAMVVFWLALRIADGDDRKRLWFALGFAAALLVVTRNITVVYLIFPALLLHRYVRSVRAVGWFALGAAIPTLVQVVVWRLLFGSWIAYSYGGEQFDFGQIRIGAVLFSPRHGFFYWHPLMLVGIAALLWWAWRRAIGWAWIASFVIITVLNAAWPCWWFASSFGNRGFEIAIFFGMFGVGVLLQATQGRPAWRRLVVGAIGAAAVWNLILFALFLTRRIPNEEAVTFAQSGHALAAWVTQVCHGVVAMR